MSQISLYIFRGRSQRLPFVMSRWLHANALDKIIDKTTRVDARARRDTRW